MKIVDVEVLFDRSKLVFYFTAPTRIDFRALVKDLVELDPAGYVKADETGETSLAGLYVAGDVRTKKLRQVVTAVSDGANAATAVAEYLK